MSKNYTKIHNRLLEELHSTAEIFKKNNIVFVMVFVDTEKKNTKKKIFHYFLDKLFRNESEPPEARKKTPIHIQMVNGLNQILVVHLVLSS